MARVRNRLYLDLLFHPAVSVISTLALALSFALPKDGVEIALCWFNALTTLPCPGCGLTRSITHLSNLDGVGALALHPFGAIVYVIMLASMTMGLMPDSARTRVWTALISRSAVFDRITRATVALFFIFGFARLLAVLTGLVEWP